ncbi:DUF3784 domain-containing protein [Rheinheimera soli]|uniref:DUF3784 domain-containing protein n=1 Tax=Rheinheimera soli TaxID=443616 RepID=A0ABU1VTR1_9GAMM|nr:DUF3784 domain-containing protein [Rheinheimera soli]MDR7119105.1 hypothetical protein [Rheinheimera soli]
MDNMWAGVAILIVAGALPCIISGYLIAVKQQRHLIAGWNESKISNPVAYARLVGFSVLLLGVAIMLIAAGLALQLLTENQLVICLLAVSVLPVIAAVAAYFRYRKA